MPIWEANDSILDLRFRIVDSFDLGFGIHSISDLGFRIADFDKENV